MNQQKHQITPRNSVSLLTVLTFLTGCQSGYSPNATPLTDFLGLGVADFHTNCDEEPRLGGRMDERVVTCRPKAKNGWTGTSEFIADPRYPKLKGKFASVRFEQLGVDSAESLVGLQQSLEKKYGPFVRTGTSWASARRVCSSSTADSCFNAVIALHATGYRDRWDPWLILMNTDTNDGIKTAKEMRGRALVE